MIFGAKNQINLTRLALRFYKTFKKSKMRFYWMYQNGNGLSFVKWPLGMSYFTLIKWKRENCKFFLETCREEIARLYLDEQLQLQANWPLQWYEGHNLSLSFLLTFQGNKVICDVLKRYFKNLLSNMFISLLVLSVLMAFRHEKS